MLTNTSISGKSEQVQMRPILAIVAACLLCSPTYGQIFPNAFWNQSKQVGSSGGCPGGVCPTQQSQNWTNNDGLSARQHVEQVHGVSTAGMSYSEVRQHQNDYHNANGAGHPVRGLVNAVVSVPRAIVQSVRPKQAFYPSQSSGKITSYGSSGSTSQAGYSSSGMSVRSGYGSSGGSVSGFAVGQRDTQGDVITSVGPVVDPVPSMAPSLPEQSIAGLGERREFRKSLLQAAKEAQDAGEITAQDYRKLAFAIRIPGVAAKMEAAMKEEAIESGVIGAAGAVDWNQLLAFIREMIPIILQLIQLFA